MAQTISPASPMAAAAPTTRTVCLAMAPLRRTRACSSSSSSSRAWIWMIVVAAKNVISLAPSRSVSVVLKPAPYRPISPITTTIIHNQPTIQQQEPQDSLEQPLEPSMVNLPVHYLSIVPLCLKAIHLVITPKSISQHHAHTHMHIHTHAHTHSAR